MQTSFQMSLNSVFKADMSLFGEFRKVTINQRDTSDEKTETSSRGTRRESDKVKECSKKTMVNIDDFHPSLGHLSLEVMRATAGAMRLNLVSKLDSCELCALGKARQANL